MRRKNMSGRRRIKKCTAGGITSSQILLISVALCQLACFRVALTKYEIDFIKSRMKLIKSGCDYAPDAGAYKPLVTSKLIFSNSNL